MSPDVLKMFLEGSPSKNARMVAAKGLAPLPPKEMLQLLAHLCHDQDGAVAAEAEHTLSAWSEQDILLQLKAPECSPSVLAHFAAPDNPATLLEAVIMHPGTPGPAVAKLAPSVPAHLLEGILYNRVRLLECPDILDNAGQNPAITPQLRALIREIEAEFFSGKKQEYSLDAGGQPADAASPPEPWELGPTDPLPADLSLEGLPVDPAEREAALIDRLSRMTVPQKIRLALLGTREVRSILIRDPNREVARNVLHSPKLSDNEIEAIAAMRNVPEDILREIGSHKGWTRSYAVVHNLVKNPKTPPMISQRLLFRLQPKDLMLLSKDRGVPEAVRHNAQRAVSQRNRTRSGP